MNIIATPAMVLTLISGFALIVYNPAWMKAGWLHTKLLGVVGLVGIHIWAIFVRRKLFSQNQPYSKVFLRLVNEIPTILMMLIVILVVLKPF